MFTNKFRLLLFTIVTFSVSCSDDNNSTSSTNTTPTPTELPAVYKKMYGATEVTLQGDYVYIKSNGRPDHKSPYYLSTQWESTMYEAYNGSNSKFTLNPNRIANQSLTFKIPVSPKAATTHSATPLGPIGVSLNGVPFYNQYAGPSQPLTNEINSFDQYFGHPQQSGQYHYHAEPYYLTTTKGSDALLGFLLDGFPVYGPVENSKTITNADLDSYHGHTAATADFPNGIYHYHITSADPYINGSGFYGTAGTVTQ